MITRRWRSGFRVRGEITRAHEKTISLHKTVSRMVNEIIIAIGLLSIAIGVLQKHFHLDSI
ncbi:hypothetical protein ACFL3A_06605 [Pseudomonadota bacterium]